MYPDSRMQPKKDMVLGDARTVSVSFSSRKHDVGHGKLSCFELIRKYISPKRCLAFLDQTKQSDNATRPRPRTASASNTKVKFISKSHEAQNKFRFSIVQRHS